MKIKIFTLTSVFLLLVGCAVGPDFEQPEYNEMPASWGNPKNADEKISAERKLSPEDITQWWKLFGDDQLCSLIERAFKSNLDMEITLAKIRQARAGVGITQSGLFPSLDLKGNITDRSSRGMGGSDVFYGAGASASWELDIFGGTRRSIEAVVENYKKSLADRCATRIEVAAEVTRNYFKYRALQQQIIITKRNLETQKKTYRITKERKANGFVSQLDVVRASAQVENTSAEIPTLESELEQARHTLEFLLGQNPNSLKEELATPKELPKIEKYIPQGVPAELVKRRPDVIAAEYAIHAAVANIGLAESDYYPRFYVTGNVSYSAPEIGGLIKNKYGSWSVGPSVSWNIFQGGKTYYNVEQSEALAQNESLNWKKTVLNALKEVEDNLSAAAKNREKIDYQTRIVQNQHKAYELSSVLYSEGEIEFLDLLDTQRSMLAAEQSQVVTRRLFIDNMILLYKALGGGWSRDDMQDKEIDKTVTAPLFLPKEKDSEK